MNSCRVISCSLSPNTNRLDVARACSLLCSSSNDIHGYLRMCEQWFVDHYHPIDFRFFLSGRQALTVLLTVFGIGVGDEVIIQAFTCMVVANAIKNVGAKPVYADIDLSYNLSVQSIKKVITKRTKAIIVQHTFSIPADICAIKKYAQKHEIILIEDLAHGFGAEIQNILLGSFGDGAFFSFGRDKSVSSVWGGAAMVLPSGKKRIIKGFESISMQSVSFMWIQKQLLHPILMTMAIHTYTCGIGKMLIEIAKRLGILSLPVSNDEKEGKSIPAFFYSYPWQLAGLLHMQLERLNSTCVHRKMIGAMYERAFHYDTPQGILSIPYLRFPVQVRKRDELLRKAKQEGILLGTWYSNVIDPKGSFISSAGYTYGQCPVAEKLAVSICNLPTNVGVSDAEKVIHCVSPYVL